MDVVWALFQYLWFLITVAGIPAWHTGTQPLANSSSPLASSPGKTSCRILIGKRGGQMGSWQEIMQTKESFREAGCTYWQQQN